MNRTRWLATGAAGLAVVMGGGAALAATGSDNPTSDFLGDVAKHLGISEDKLEGAIEEATVERIDAAVAAGEITKEEGEALKERARSGHAPALGLGGPGFGAAPVGPPPKGLLPGFLPGSDLMETAAEYLEMEAVDVRKALRDGKSLAELAKDKGKSVEGLKDALRDELRKDAGRMVEKLEGAIDKLVEGDLRDGIDFHHRGGGGDFGLHLRVRPAP
jgi:hypothetical protein